MKSICGLRTVAVGLFLGCVVGMSSVGYAADTGSATEAIKGTIDRVLEVLQQKELQHDDKKSERLTRLIEVIGQRFDYEEMGKRTISREWKDLNPQQQKEFVALFQRFLTKSYAGNVDSYSGEKVEYVKERTKGNFAEVQTKVISPKSRVPIDYRLIKKTQEWRVYDVIIDGVSLMKNYRGQFARILKTSSFDGLLAKLRTKADQASQP
ncbi:MAG: toluene tolerance protein [Nitrospirales bacterium]|nr:MAG: toluene tolerance protein [Nitrospirales bacterium]